MSDSEATTPVFESKPALQQAARSGLAGGAVGLVVSSVQNALGTHTRGAMGVVTRTGGTIGFFGTFESLLLTL